MAASIEWLRKGLALPGKNQKGLARVLGISPSQMSRMMSGGRNLKADEIPLAAEYFGIAAPMGFGEDAAVFEGKNQEKLAPIYRVVGDSASGWLIERHEAPIDSKPRAPHFVNSAKVFGFYAPDEAMAPRFKQGEIAWVDPARPPKAGDEVVLIGKTKSPGPERIILAELRKIGSAEITISQYGNPAERAYDPRRWNAMLVLPRY